MYCSECHRSTLLPSYQLHYFVEKKSKYTCISFTLPGLVDLSLDGDDVLINRIQGHLVEIGTKTIY